MIGFESYVLDDTDDSAGLAHLPCREDDARVNRIGVVRDEGACVLEVDPFQVRHPLRIGVDDGVVVMQFDRPLLVRFDEDVVDLVRLQFCDERLRPRRVRTDDDVIGEVPIDRRGCRRRNGFPERGKKTAGSARKNRPTPVTSRSITSAFISALAHGKSEPYPVAVNVSTTTYIEWRIDTLVPSGGYGPGSKARIPRS